MNSVGQRDLNIHLKSLALIPFVTFPSLSFLRAHSPGCRNGNLINFLLNFQSGTEILNTLDFGQYIDNNDIAHHT
jgi:hypothetical protein